jgi:DNA-directed RNA polymerase specialized sigma24 family protein
VRDRAALGDDFTIFVAHSEPRLRRSLISMYGAQRGREAAAEALAWAWEHWPRVQTMENPIAYLFRVGQSKSRPRKARAFAERPNWPEPWVEPDLTRALGELTERQRVAVVLVHGFGWTLREVSELTGVSVSTTQSHLERGVDRLRSVLEVAVDG